MTLRAPYSGWRKGWWTQTLPKDAGQACYRRKRDALNVFLDYNRGIVDDYGGESMKHSPASFDAINQQFDIKGSRRIDTIAKAVWWAMPVGGPFCMENVDLDLLNRTAPAEFNQRGLQFELPEPALEEKLAREELEYYQQQYGLGGKMGTKHKMRFLPEMVIIDDPWGEVVAWHQQEWIDEPDLVQTIANASFEAGQGKNIRQKISPGLEGRSTGKMRKKGTHRKATSTRGWAKASPDRVPERRAILDRCGINAFLKVGQTKTGLPDPQYPVVAKGSGCAPDCRGLWAAKQRASQTGRPSLERKATKIAKAAGCAWAKGEK